MSMIEDDRCIFEYQKQSLSDCCLDIINFISEHLSQTYIFTFEQESVIENIQDMIEDDLIDCIDLADMDIEEKEREEQRLILHNKIMSECRLLEKETSKILSMYGRNLIKIYNEYVMKTAAIHMARFESEGSNFLEKCFEELINQGVIELVESKNVNLKYMTAKNMRFVVKKDNIISSCADMIIKEVN